jgi:DNA-binding response OmpR family regulator
MRANRLGGVVLIIERDDAIRRMISVVLEGARFRVHAVSDLEAAAGVLARERVDAVVRDVSLTPGNRRESLRDLAATPSDVLRKTIVATTGKGIDDANVFAVVRKPFDVSEIVRLVTACVRRTSQARLAPPVSLESLQRFVSSVSSLRRVLTATQASPHEMLLRGEMRRAILELSVLLHEASRSERNRTRAAAFLAASVVAAELAGGGCQVAAKPRAAARAGH